MGDMKVMQLFCNSKPKLFYIIPNSGTALYQMQEPRDSLRNYAMILYNIFGRTLIQSTARHTCSDLS
jgi:hypothetical protein